MTDPTASKSRRYVLVAAILASSMGFIDSSVLSIAIPAMRADLGASLSEAQWISNAYLLLLSALILLGGAAGDRFGVRRMFMAGIGLFVIASLACAVAPSSATLILARAVQGLGAAFMVPGSLAIIAKTYPKDERGRAIGIWAATSSLTTIAGPIVGGLVLTALGDWSWRLVFAINLPLGIAALMLLVLGVKPDQAQTGRRLDIGGAALATLALFAFAYGLIGGGSESTPPLSHVALWCGLGLVTGVAFLFWEARHKQPMLPLNLFASRQFSGANALTFTLYFSFGGVLFFLPMAMIAGWGVSAATVAIALLPMGLMLAVLSSLSGKWADRFGPGPVLTLGALIVAAAFALLGATAPLHQVWLATAPAVALLGLGMGMVVSPLSTAVMTSISDGDTGTASGVNNAVARVAGLFAIALFGVVVAQVFERALGPVAELPIFFGLPAEGLSAAQESARVNASDTAFAAVAYVAAALALVSAATAWLTLNRKSDQFA
ncbi:MFS transporter [Devosia sp. RR2S18]|uniref:MFS transporter n=1 Tax=Devosia rhizosphaerae TaxID=3049774 RepID=UPI00254078F1|nr:MFS transporter [Devosia sp. RR2S18]WIJ25685.1 MFS transporter [Devosia sp. RR2S18]